MDSPFDQRKAIIVANLEEGKSDKSPKGMFYLLGLFGEKTGANDCRRSRNERDARMKIDRALGRSAIIAPDSLCTPISLFLSSPYIYLSTSSIKCTRAPTYASFSRSSVAFTDAILPTLM